MQSSCLDDIWVRKASVLSLDADPTQHWMQISIFDYFVLWLNEAVEKSDADEPLWKSL